MKLTQDVWGFVVALAAVINGLGIVRLIAALGDYVKKRASLDVTHYWPYGLTATFQLLLHVLLWWSVLGLKAVGQINFLSYLYLLVGPTLLFLATTILLPDVASTSIDLKADYRECRKSYYTILSIFWVWTVFLWPAFGYPFPPTVKFLLLWLPVSLTLRFSENDKVHAALAVANILIFAAFVALYAMKLGEVGRLMTQ